jgi:hypothetical protein
MLRIITDAPDYIAVSTEHPMEARSWSKMQEKPDFKVRSAKVVVNLTRRTFMKVSTRLGLNDEFLVYDHVEPLNSELLTLVHDTNADLSRHIVLSGEQLALERHDVQMLEKPVSKMVINLEEGPNNRSCKRLFNEFAARHDA